MINLLFKNSGVYRKRLCNKKFPRRRFSKLRFPLGILPTLSLGTYLLAGWPALTQAAPNYVASEIPRSQDAGRPFFADMDGDGAIDVLVTHWSLAQGRELYIYLQQSDGRFAPEPSRRVEIKPEIIAVATAELGNHPGNELIFVSSDAVYSFSSSIQSYSGNIEKLFDWPLIASMPNRKRLIYLGELPDLDMDGNVDLVLPYGEGVGIFRGTDNNKFVLTSKIKTANKSLVSKARSGGSVSVEADRQFIDDEGNIVLNVSPPTSSQFGNFLREWKPRERVGNINLVRTNDWVAGVALAAIDADDKLDVVFLNEKEDKLGRLNLLIQNDDGSFPVTPTMASEIATEGTLRLVDYSGDGLSDMIKIVSHNNDWDLFFYRNNNGNFKLDAPEQVMRFSGYELKVDFIDLNEDSKPELNISYYTIPVMDVIRDVRIQRTRLLYENKGLSSDRSTDADDEEEHLVFNQRPDYKLEEKFAADDFLALNSLDRLGADINNDQKIDYIYIAGDGTLKAKTISSETLGIDNTAFWQYVPDHAILDVTLEELNADSMPDLVLFHSLHFTLLISTQ